MPVLAYGPPAADTSYHYVGYVCHPGADVRMADQRTQFVELAKLFATPDEARKAAYAEGRGLVETLIGDD
jgi:hypothetical protein